MDGKTNKRTAIARDRVVDFLWRQAQLNPRITAGDFDALILSKLDAPVFTTRLNATVTVHNLNRAFNALLDELGIKIGASVKQLCRICLLLQRLSKLYIKVRDLSGGRS